MDIRQEIEYIEIQVEKVETLHAILLDKYFRVSPKAIKLHSSNPDDKDAVYDLCASYKDYSTLIDISYDSLGDIKSKLNDVIDELYKAKV